MNISVKRDEKIAKAGQLELVEDYKVIISWASLLSLDDVAAQHYGNIRA